MPRSVIGTTEYTEWQRTLSGVHSIMMEKLAQAGEGGGCTSFPFHYIYHHVQLKVLSSEMDQAESRLIR
jgi:hypothetical protein